jgi:hypothetical protein
MFEQATATSMASERPNDGGAFIQKRARGANVDEEPAGSVEKIVRGIDGPRPIKDSTGGILPRGHEGAISSSVGLHGKQVSTLNTYRSLFKFLNPD